jgi:hypothetical protein
MKRREIIAALATSFGCLFIKTLNMAASDEKPSNISLIRLIANPSAFDGRRLRLTGYVANNGLDRAVGLYLSEIDAHNFIVLNSVDLRIDESALKSLVDTYVTLVGTFHAPSAEASGYNGYLDHISNARAWQFGDKG